MISHEEVQQALATLQQYASENRAPMRGQMEAAQTAVLAEELEHEIHGERFFTVTGNWIPSRERYSAKIWATDRRTAEDQVRAEVQAKWEAAGYEGPAQFLISACFYGEPEQADVGVKTSDD